MNIFNRSLLCLAFFLVSQIVQASSYDDSVLLAQDAAGVLANDDMASMYKNQGTLSGSVNTNDKGGLFSLLDSSPVGQYGSLIFNSNGDYTYVLNSNSIALQNLQVNQSLSETFLYSLKSQNNSSSAKLTILIIGVVDPESKTSFYALNDEASIFALAVKPVTGNVTSNDEGFKTVEIRSNIVTAYGTLSFNSAGVFSYTVRDNLSLSAGSSFDDIFVYRIYDAAGFFEEARLTIHVIGQTVAQETAEEFNAENDVASITKNSGGGANGTTAITGNVTANDNGVISSSLISSAISDVGSLSYTSSGDYVYTLFNDSQRVSDLALDESLKDTFTYQIRSIKGSFKQATLTITILGAPGEISSGVEIESNNTSSTSTPIYITTPPNEPHTVKGNLNSGEDKDWYSMQSLGNEIIHFDLCPPASSCYDGKAWVLYVFDEAKLAASNKEGNTVSLRLTGDDTGLGYGISTKSNHLYLNYNEQAFTESLIGVIDPCFGASTTLDIGVGSNSKTYLIAISSPLQRDGGAGCTSGNIILEKAGPTGSYEDGAGDPQTETTTQQYISYFPNSDDQYLFSVTRTGPNPVRSTAVKSASFNNKSGILNIPKVKVGDEIYTADLLQSDTKKIGTTNNPQFLIEKLKKLQKNVGTDPGMATYNPASNVVFIPKYFNEITNEYSYLIFLYHPRTDTIQEWLELLYSDTIK